MERHSMILSLILLLSALFAQEPPTGGIPDWYLDLPEVDGKYRSVGMGQYRMQAVLDAIAALEANYQSIVEGRQETFTNEDVGQWDGITNTLTTGKFMKEYTNDEFSLESRTSSFIQEKGDGSDSEIWESFEAIFHLKYGTKDQEYAFLQSFFKESGVDMDSEIQQKFEALFQNMDETVFFERLGQYGFSFQFARDDQGRHYALISVDE